jgi:hypothetical protein
MKPRFLTSNAAEYPLSAAKPKRRERAALSPNDPKGDT